MSDIRSITNKRRNRPRVPSHFHAQSSPQKPRTKGSDRCPSKWQSNWVIPSFQVVCRPSTTKNKVLFHYNSHMNHSPVSDDAEECLKGVVEILRCTASYDDGNYESKCYQYDSWYPNGPWAEILGMQCEGIVIRDVVLKGPELVAARDREGDRTHRNSAQCCNDHEKLAESTSRLQRHLEQSSNRRVRVSFLPCRIRDSPSIHCCAEGLNQDRGEKDTHVCRNENPPSWRILRHAHIIVCGAIDPRDRKGKYGCYITQYSSGSGSAVELFRAGGRKRRCTCACSNTPDDQRWDPDEGIYTMNPCYPHCTDDPYHCADYDNPDPGGTLSI